MVDLVQWSLFLLFSALVLGGALGVFLTMSMYRAGISLMLCLVAMAGLFILLEADLLAVIQVMMNVGGMLVMTLFMVMLMMDPGGEMMWDMKRRMRMKGFGALSMSMPAELPAEKPEEQGRSLSPPHSHSHAIAAVPAGEGGSPGEKSLPQENEASAGTADGNDGTQGTVEITDGYRERGNTMTEKTEAGTNGSKTESGDPFRRMREMQRSIAIMQQQLGLMQEQLVELQEDLLAALPNGGQGQTPSTGSPNNTPRVTAAAYQMGQPSSHDHTGPASEVNHPAQYTCPMHPEIRQSGPGRCPKCGMELVPVEESPASSTVSQSDSSSRVSTGSGSISGSSTTTTMYTCPMHPEVRLPGPGRCPKCGMDLVPEEGGGSDNGDGDNGNGGATGTGTGQRPTSADSASGGTGSQGGHDHGHMAHSSNMGGRVETAEQMQRRSPKAYYRMMADMAMNTRQLPLAGLFSMLAGFLLVVLVLLVAWPSRPAAPDLDGPSRVGDLLLSDYMIAFEGAAFLILAGILGAVLLARRERKRQGVRRKQVTSTTSHTQEVH